MTSEINLRPTILIATTNQGKLKEISGFLAGLPINPVSLNELGISTDFKETGTTYFSNSKDKALFFTKISGLPTIADDGGLEIEALNFEPGVMSRRWLGFEASDEELTCKLREVARTLPDNKRRAYFKVVITFALSNGKFFQRAGEVEGIIAREPQSGVIKGYPYRSFFYFPEIKKYYNENEFTTREQKIYNHRYKAIQKIKKIIKRELF